MTESVYFFSELKNRDQLWAGGKGRTLARLYRKGYQIPNGFLIMPSAFQGDEVLSQTWTRVRANLEQMRGVMTEIAFAVRSSALGEDSISASFAGQYKTILAVRTDEEVRQAVEAVRRSRHSIEVQAYCAALGMEIPPDMAVVVQQMVPAEISGVLFTADPLTGSRSKMTGNFTFGLGEIMVSGRIMPHTFTLQQAGSLSLENSYNGPPALKSWARRLFKLARAFALRAGQLTGLGDNIFFLTIEELLGVLMGDATAVQYIPMRKEKHSQYMALPVYPPFIRGYFDPLRWAADPSRQPAVRGEWTDYRGTY